jgi:hypothetical protein
MAEPFGGISIKAEELETDQGGLSAAKPTETFRNRA